MKNANLMLGEGMCPHCLGMIEVETDPDGNLTIAAIKKETPMEYDEPCHCGSAICEKDRGELILCGTCGSYFHDNFFRWLFGCPGCVEKIKRKVLGSRGTAPAKKEGR